MPGLTLEMRKPIDQLVPDDLAYFPIWEFATDEEEVPERDETWVRPVNSQTIPRGRYSLSVAADFTTASGRNLVGILEVDTTDSVEIRFPVILDEDRYLFIRPSDSTNRESVAAALSLAESEIFPLSFALRVLVDGESQRRRGIVS